MIALGLTTGSIGPTLPALAIQTNSSVSAISYLFTFRSFGYVFGAFGVGKLFDRHPGNTIMGVAIFIAVVAMTIVAFVTQLWVLLLVMFVLGVTESSFDVGANTLLVRVHGERVAPYMNAMHACFGIGSLIAPLIVAQLTRSGHAMTNVYVVLAVMLIPIGLFSFTSPSPKMKAILSAKQDLTNSRFTLISLVIFLFLYVGIEVGVGGWLFTYALLTNLGTATTAAYLTSLFWGSLTLGRILMIPIATRIKPEMILAFSLSGTLLSLGVMLAGPHTLLIMSVAIGGLGVSLASIFPATLSFASHRMTVTGAVTGWFIVGSSLGATLIPMLMGQLVPRIGPLSIVATPALAMFVAAGVFTLLWSHRTSAR